MAIFGSVRVVFMQTTVIALGVGNAGVLNPARFLLSAREIDIHIVMATAGLNFIVNDCKEISGLGLFSVHTEWKGEIEE